MAVCSFDVLTGSWGWNWCLLTPKSPLLKEQKCSQRISYSENAFGGWKCGLRAWGKVLGVLSVFSTTASCFAWSKLDSNCTQVIIICVLSSQHTTNQPGERRPSFAEGSLYPDSRNPLKAKRLHSRNLQAWLCVCLCVPVYMHKYLEMLSDCCVLL